MILPDFPVKKTPFFFLILSVKKTALTEQEQGCDVILKNTFLEFVPVEPAPEKMPRSHSCFASLAGQPGENQDFVETDISDVDAEDAKDGVHSEATSTEFDEDVTDGELSPQRTPLNILEALPADSWIIADSSRLCERICTTNLFAELLHEYIDKTIMVPKWLGKSGEGDVTVQLVAHMLRYKKLCRIMQRNVDLMVKETKNFELLAAKAPLHFAPCVALVPVPPGQIALNCSVPVIMGHMAGERSVEPVESDECKAKNKSLQKFINKKLCEAGLGMWVCGMVGWWDGGMVGWWDGGMVGWWEGGMVGWWDGGMLRAHLLGISFLLTVLIRKSFFGLSLLQDRRMPPVS